MECPPAGGHSLGAQDKVSLVHLLILGFLARLLIGLLARLPILALALLLLALLTLALLVFAVLRGLLRVAVLGIVHRSASMASATPGIGRRQLENAPFAERVARALVHPEQSDPQYLEDRAMSIKSALAVLVAGCALSTAAWAASDADCAAQWKSADGNNDGVLAGPEADRYLAYYRVRARTTPVDGRITEQDFIAACKSDVFMAKPPGPGAPLKGANSFTEGQAKDRIVAAGYTGISALARDGDGIWRGGAMKDGKSVKVAVDFKGNVVSQ